MDARTRVKPFGGLVPLARNRVWPRASPATPPVYDHGERLANDGVATCGERLSPRLGCRFDTAAVQCVDQLPQAAQAAAVEAKDQPRECCQVGFVLFLGQRSADREFAAVEDVGEFGVDRRQQLGRWALP